MGTKLLVRDVLVWTNDAATVRFEIDEDEVDLSVGIFGFTNIRRGQDHTAEALEELGLEYPDGIHIYDVTEETLPFWTKHFDAKRVEALYDKEDNIIMEQDQ